MAKLFLCAGGMLAWEGEKEQLHNSLLVTPHLATLIAKRHKFESARLLVVEIKLLSQIFNVFIKCMEINYTL